MVKGGSLESSSLADVTTNGVETQENYKLLKTGVHGNLVRYMHAGFPLQNTAALIHPLVYLLQDILSSATWFESAASAAVRVSL